MTRPEVISRVLPRAPDPLDYYAARTRDGTLPGTALLESADSGRGGTRRSLLVLSSALRVALVGDRMTIEALGANGRAALERLGGDGDRIEIAVGRTGATDRDEDARLRGPSVLDPLRDLLATLRPERAADHHRLLLVGAMAFELAERFEPGPPREDAEPDYVFLVPELMLDIDHLRGRAELVALAFDLPSRNDLSARLDALRHEPEPFAPGEAEAGESEPRVDCGDGEYAARVEAARAAILAGEVFQLVLSRSWEAPCTRPLAAYARLRRENPSPYLFYFRDRDVTLFGASPESAVRLDGRTRLIDIYPVAGTRPRGGDADEDARIEAELRQDPKELAEHMMLVDLARNDIARVCVPGSRGVPVLLGVDRYAHVMHLVSRVQGTLRPGLDALHALRACLNMGTLTGAPKLRASELIRRIEGRRRGFYGGAVGFIDGAGDMDTAITIRAASVRDGLARIQAGAGIVLDSDPPAEALETRHKARAVLRAAAGEP